MFGFHPILFLYSFFQSIITYLFAPRPPNKSTPLNGPRIAIIGAGLTGVSAAAHCVSHGSDVVIFEASSKDIGGIWARVNSASGLQIHSIMYRFHPSVNYTTGGYPRREQILEQIRGVWKRYGLETKTVFGTRVESCRQDGSDGKWIINGNEEWRFDGVIAAVGTCGEPKMPHVPGIDEFRGQKVHSSQLDGVDVEGKTVLVVGGGASAIEVLEYAAQHGAEKVTLLARSDKWIIPRNPLIDALLSLNIFGMQLPTTFIPEFLLRKLFYRDLSDLSPAPGGPGLFESTPMVNDDVLSQIRSGKASWLRGDISHFASNGVHYSIRQRGVPAGGPGKSSFIPGDIVVFATGFNRPSLSFLPAETFNEPYAPPNWYLQTFPPTHISVSAINCTYINAIGTVGHFHIGCYTRILLMFLNDPLTRPPNESMKFWIRLTSWIKSKSPTPAFDFFTYGELVWWFVEVCLVNPFRWKHVPFVLFGWGMPQRIMERERRIEGFEKIERGPI